MARSGSLGGQGALRTVAGGAPRPPSPGPGAQPARTAQVEVHLLDFDGDLYGESARIRFGHFLRSERKFDGIDALVAQLKHDIEHARELLS